MTQPQRERLAATATAGVLAVLVAGCSPATPPVEAPTAVESTAASSPWTVGADPDDVDRTDPDQVSRAFATELLSYDTTHDTSILDAAARAGALATEQFATDLVDPQRAAGSGWWSEAAEHDASARVRVETVEDEGMPPNDAERAFGLWSVRWWITGSDGWSGPVTEQVLYINMIPRGDEWAVDQVSVR